MYLNHIHYVYIILQAWIANQESVKFKIPFSNTTPMTYFVIYVTFVVIMPISYGFIKISYFLNTLITLSYNTECRILFKSSSATLL